MIDHAALLGKHAALEKFGWGLPLSSIGRAAAKPSTVLESAAARLTPGVRAPAAAAKTLPGAGPALPATENSVLTAVGVPSKMGPSKVPTSRSGPTTPVDTRLEAQVSETLAGQGRLPHGGVYEPVGHHLPYTPPRQPGLQAPNMGYLNKYRPKDWSGFSRGIGTM